jgi:2-polyprenyl-3-methyl-5-hydroxy-6-metoxy-1,4-benzoquinol methylase
MRGGDDQFVISDSTGQASLVPCGMIGERVMQEKKADRDGYNKYYKDKSSLLRTACSAEEYVALYERRGLSPYYSGGNTKGYVRGLATRTLLDQVEASGRAPSSVTVLDAGAGLGELSVYLACKGFNVVGVDISEAGIAGARELADRIGVSEGCRFVATSLEHTGEREGSIDYIIGHASLHHFIKYKSIPVEFSRILKSGGEAFFADSFGENVVYHLFHNKKEMEELGDVVLNRKLIRDFFQGFEVMLTPTDWFVMMDKLFQKVMPPSMEPVLRGISRLFFHIDRLIPANNGLSLALSGAVMTRVRKGSVEDSVGTDSGEAGRQ